MFNSTFKKAIASTFAVAMIATTVSTTPAMAGGGGGRDPAPAPKVSTISSPNEDGTTTSIRSVNGEPTYTITKKKNGKVVSKKRVKKKRPDFVTLHNPDGTSTTITAKDR